LAETADTIVIGLGAMGSAALYQLAKRGQKVIGIDRFTPPHDRGSSHGETRITRQAVGEGGQYVPIVLRSHEIWREIEAETRETLFLSCGTLVLSPRVDAAAHHGKDNFLARTLECARNFGIPHDEIKPDEIAARFPQIRLRGDEIGYFEPGGGLLFPERCIATQIRLAEAHGAQIRTSERVVKCESFSANARVTTERATYEAENVVMAAGGWIRGLAGKPLEALALQRQTLHWFQSDCPEQYRSDRFSVFIWIHGPEPEDLFYGFPTPPGGEGVKVATETSLPMSGEPDDIDRTVHAWESEQMFKRHLAGRFHGLGPTRLRATACLYTVTPDSDFVIDRHPEQPRVLLVSACSGHGFKHSAAIGEAAAAAVTGENGPSILSAFRLSRLQ
jgi:sarcosine oxidase